MTIVDRYLRAARAYYRRETMTERTERRFSSVLDGLFARMSEAERREAELRFLRGPS